MALSTRLTQRFGIAHPIISAPMAFAAGGRLAAAVTSAGGLGLIGGGYGDAGMAGKRKACRRQRASRLRVHHLVAAHAPRAARAGARLSSARRLPVVRRIRSLSPRAIKAAGVALICQVQTRRDAEHALELRGGRDRRAGIGGRRTRREARHVHARSRGRRPASPPDRRKRCCAPPAASPTGADLPRR